MTYFIKIKLLQPICNENPVISQIDSIKLNFELDDEKKDKNA